MGVKTWRSNCSAVCWASAAQGVTGAVRSSCDSVPSSTLQKQQDHEQLSKDLSGPGCVATGDDVGGDHLWSNEVAPRIRTVQLDLADAEERGLDSVEHRRGAGAW